VIENFPKSFLATLISSPMQEGKVWTKEETYNEKLGKWEEKAVDHYSISKNVHPDVFKDILYWMESGNSALLKARYPVDTLLHHADYLSLPELMEAVVGKESETVGEFVKIPGGTYEIGSPEGESNRGNDERLHAVTLSAFEIAKTAVTQESCVKKTGKNPSKFQEKKYCPDSHKEIEVNGVKIQMCPTHPVENVNWDEANEYAKAESADDPIYEYGLPLEAQQEVAFRGGTKTAYVSGNDAATVDGLAWHNGNSGGQTQPVDRAAPNAYGIHKSSVWEWGQDWYNTAYEGSTGLDPKDSQTGSARVLRGGSWDYDVQCCRSADRGSGDPSKRRVLGNVGFRLVRTPRNSK
jgi:formylglycine-generating enzyme required for sulfatase activity